MSDAQEWFNIIREIGEGTRAIVCCGSFGCLTDDCDHWNNDTCRRTPPDVCKIGRTYLK